MTDGTFIDGDLSAHGREALAEEAVLNAAMAFAAHVAQEAVTRAQQTAEGVDARISDAIYRQFLLETATLCLRRLGEALTTELQGSKGSADTDGDAVRLSTEAVARIAEATSAVEAIGDLSLDLLDRILDPRI